MEKVAKRLMWLTGVGSRYIYSTLSEPFVSSDQYFLAQHFGHMRALHAEISDVLGPLAVRVLSFGSLSATWIEQFDGIFVLCKYQRSLDFDSPLGLRVLNGIWLNGNRHLAIFPDSCFAPTILGGIRQLVGTFVYFLSEHLDFAKTIANFPCFAFDGTCSGLAVHFASTLLSTMNVSVTF